MSSDGPFPQFSGVDRQLYILEVRGVKLLMSDNAAKPKGFLLHKNQQAF
nr:hypothetical protein [Shewanella baltica]